MIIYETRGRWFCVKIRNETLFPYQIYRQLFANWRGCITGWLINFRKIWNPLETFNGLFGIPSNDKFPRPRTFRPRIYVAKHLLPSCNAVRSRAPSRLLAKNVQTFSFPLLFVQRLDYNWRKKVWIDAHACYVGNQVSSKSRATGVSRELQFSVGRDRRSINVRSIHRRIVCRNNRKSNVSFKKDS